jgi:hypothetical protein
MKFLILDNPSVHQVDGVEVFYKNKFIKKTSVTEVSRDAKFHDSLPTELQE